MARAYRPNSNGFRAIGVGPEMRKVLAAVAEKGKAHAEALAAQFSSTDDSDGEATSYAERFEVQDVTVEWSGRHPGPRAAARLVNTSEYAAAVEWGGYGRPGSEPGPAHRVLGRTLEFLDAEGRA